MVGPTGTSLLGRFCGADPALTDRVRALADAEARLAGDALVAEIVHLPHERTGNVACRPALRDSRFRSWDDRRRGATVSCRSPT